MITDTDIEVLKEFVGNSNVHTGTTTVPYILYTPYPSPCPTCGTCPTCGRRSTYAPFQVTYSNR